MIYFIQAGKTGPIKIGSAANPEKRLKQLQTGADTELRLLKTIPGDQKMEKALHSMLRDYQRNGEWFDPECLRKLSLFGGDIPVEEYDGKLYPVLYRPAEDKNTDPCPYCFNPHFHGEGDGHRATHCGDFRLESITVHGQIIPYHRGYIVRTRRIDPTARFIAAWIAAGGKETRTADLLPFAIEADVPLLENPALQARSLGTWLGKVANQAFLIGESWIAITPGKFDEGFQYWVLRSVQAPKQVGGGI